MPEAAAVRSMFASIASRYDLVNTVMSAGIDHLWRVRAVNSLTAGENAHVLDACTGTGMFVPLLSKRFSRVTGVDFCAAMLDKAEARFAAPGVTFLEADALALPFDDASFDAVTVGFGVRNFADLRAGLRELRRVLKPGGQICVLEFGQPKPGLWGGCYGLYSKFIMPVVGRLISGNADAYRYLPETAARFPCGEDFAAVLRGAGFDGIQIQSLSGGIAYLYIANAR